MIVRSWDGLRAPAIAAELHCHPQTVRERITRFNTAGLDGLGDRPGAGRKPRLTEAECSRLIALVAETPPGRLVRQDDGTLGAADTTQVAHWTLNSLTAAAQARGIRVARSQVRRILRAERVRWRQPRAWATSTDPDFAPIRTTIIELYTAPPPDATVLCVDELGPVSPRTFPPGPGWSPDGHRIKAPLEYSRGPEKVWVYGALRLCDGQALTLTAPARNTVGYRTLLDAIAGANPQGALYVIGENLSSHKSPPIQEWLVAHPRVHPVFIPKGASWLNLQAPWWRLFCQEALAGQSFADDTEITYATRVATEQLNHRAKPWVWGRPSPPPRCRRRCFVYCL